MSEEDMQGASPLGVLPNTASMENITSLAPAPGAASANPAGEKNPLRPFGFWLTLLLTVGGIIFSIVVANMFVFAGAILLHILGLPSSIEWVVGLAKFSCIPMAIAAAGWVVLWTFWRGGTGLYCGLVWPARKEWLRALILIVLFGIVSELACRFFGVDPITPWQRELFAGCGFPGLVLLFVALVFCAPLWEELLFRGFSQTGWTSSFLRARGTVIFSSLLWALLHSQYEMFFIGMIFVYGLLLGYLRWRSGSLLLCMTLHAVLNLVAFIQTYYAVFVAPISA